MVGSTGNTILVVDDDQDILQTIKGNLELDGFDILCASDGTSGIETAKKSRPDLILLDLNLPDMDGIKVCRIIRQELDIPIIMLTARSATADMIRGFEYGADDYIVKPFNAMELVARINAVLKRVARGAEKRHLKLAGITIDFASGKVIVDECKVKLTITEHRLLELFMSYPDQALSRRFIRDRIWSDPARDIHSRTVDMHVQRLRKKLEPETQNSKYISTVTGIGYKFKTG